jgi:nucleoid-associated protein YgaU
MALAKLTIVPEVGDDITAMYNPEKYSVSKSVQYAEVAIPGLDAPVVQFVRGQNEKLTMELFFDTTDLGMVENVTDVREQTAKVYRLLKVDSETHAPPRVMIDWGDGGQITSYDADIPPWLVLESVTQEFTLFSPSGVPLRARLNTTFREAWTIDEQLSLVRPHSSDRTKLRRVVRGETLSHIAAREYNDPGEWRPIAEENGLDNPRLLAPGTSLVIPRHKPVRRPAKGTR